MFTSSVIILGLTASVTAGPSPTRIAHIPDLDKCNVSVNELYKQNVRCIEILDDRIIKLTRCRGELEAFKTHKPEPVVETAVEYKTDMLMVGIIGLIGFAAGGIASFALF